MSGVRRNHDTHEFWEGCQARELRIMRCQDCGTWIHLPRRICPDCWSENVRPEVVGGQAHLLTYSRPRTPDDAAPVITALVALDAALAVHLLGRLVDCAPSDVQIGMALEIDWRDEQGQLVPQFRAAGPGR